MIFSLSKRGKLCAPKKVSLLGSDDLDFPQLIICPLALPQVQAERRKKSQTNSARSVSVSVRDGSGKLSPCAHSRMPLILPQGSYFGELALLNDDVRQANVTALESTICLTLDRATFKRVVGPLEVGFGFAG